MVRKWRGSFRGTRQKLQLVKEKLLRVKKVYYVLFNRLTLDLNLGNPCLGDLSPTLFALAQRPG